MKRITHLLTVVIWIGLGAIPLSGWAQSVLNMPQFGKQIMDVEEEITFYDTKGTNSISSSSSNNAYSTVVFKPITEGQVVQITFSEVDVRNDGTSWPAALYIYNGVFDPENTVTYPTTTSGVTVTGFPETDNLLDKLDGTYTNLSYTSTSSDGALSVCFHYKYAKDCDGWTATVRAVEAKDMVVTAAGSSYEQIETEPVVKESVGLVGFYVDADGFMNADRLTSVSFTLPVNEGVVAPEEVKLYVGQGASFKGQDALVTSLVEDGGTYTLTLDKELVPGRNWFTLAADILADAAFGSKVQAVASGLATVAHPEGLSGFAAATPVALTVPYMVLMSDIKTPYQVGENAIHFYDSGGKDGKITSKYDGYTTFVPTTAGRRIQIDFTSVGLYENTFGSSSNDDVLKVYDGQTVDEQNLNVALHNAVPQLVRSNAADGSLTVYLKSVTGDYYIGTGFEALVSEFVPQQMTVQSIVPAQYTNGTVCAGDENQAILSVNVKTENTLSLSLTSLTFSIDGTTVPANLTKATVYSTNRSAEFATTNKIGETVLTGSSTFDVACDVELKEGDNYFWLAYDLDVRTLNGDAIDAGIVSITCSDGKHVVADGNPTGNRLVKNEYVSQNGAFTKQIYGEWDYTYVCSYSGESEQKVTFVPVTDGHVVELNYSAFKLNCPSYYETTPIYAIYSGTTTATDKLIWKLSKADQTVALNENIRPLDGDNALTVVYNYNGLNQSSSYGWTAKVREYLPKDMTYDGTDVAQATTDFIASGDTEQAILSLKVTTSGDKNPLSLGKVTVDLKGCQTYINKVSLYYTGKQNTFAADRLVGSLDVDGTSGTVEIPVEDGYTLDEGECYYWITYDISADAVPGQEADARVVSLTIGGVEQAVADGDPEGSREIKNVYLMPTSGHEIILVGEYPYMFYDDGGADGQYSSTQNGSVTFVPAAEGQVIKITFRQFKCSYNDYLRFYNGDENSTDKLGEYTLYSDPAIGSYLLSQAEDGSVTVKFDRTGYSVNDGWEIEVSSYVPQPLSVTAVSATAVNRKQLLAGSQNEKMLCVSLEVGGDKGEVTVEEMTFAVTGSEQLETMKVYYTGTSANYSSEASLFGEGQTGETPVFAGSQVLTSQGVYYFWLACDLQAGAEVGATVSFVPTAVKVDGNELELGEPETAVLTVKDGFHGTHTVGPNGEYATLSAAIEDMSIDGINGPVVLELESGTYDETAYLTDIVGTSAVNTITIRSASGNYEDVTICPTVYKGGDYGSTDNGVLTVHGTDYLTIEGLTFATGDQSYKYLVDVRNASTYLTVRNCRFQRPVESTTNRYLLHTDWVNNPVDGVPNTNMTIENNLFEGGYIGLQVGGYNTVEENRNFGTVVRNNTFRDQYNKAVYVTYDIATLVEGNTITRTGSDTKEYDAIDLSFAYEGAVVRNNTIDLSGGYVIGIKARPMAGTETSHARIYNNVINLRDMTENSYGIHLSNSLGKYMDIAHNTVRITGANSGSAGFFDTTKTTDVVVQNNIFQNEAGGYAYRLNSSSYAVLLFNNNMLYTSGTVLVYTADELDMDAWVAIGRETGSYNEQVTFLSDEILAPRYEGNLKNAAPLDFVETDIAGSVRDAEQPTIGAYEYAEVVPAEMEEGYPVLRADATYNSADVLVKATENAVAYYLCRTEGETPDVETIVEAGQTVSLPKAQETTVQLRGLQASTDYYVFFVLKTLASGDLSSVYALDMFTTAFRPTEVSTFEEVTTTEGAFEDGTALFDGFVVEEIADGMGADNYRAARMAGSTATITLTNTTTGLPLTGFYLKSDAEVLLTVSETTAKTVEATGGEWIFCNLKDMGTILSVALATEGTEVYIDDFSGDPQPITFLIDGAADEPVAAGTQVALYPYLYGGVPPYTYQWTNAGSRELLSTEETYGFEADYTKLYRLTVTDAWGTEAADEVTVHVTSGAKTATFEDLYLEEESYNDPNTYDDGTYMFYSGTYGFSNTVNTWEESAKYWSGFSYSNATSTVFTGAYWKEQYYSAAGSGANGSANYAIAYVSPEVRVTITNSEAGETVGGFYVTNSAWAKDIIQNGNGDGPDDEGFELGDYFQLTATGYDADGVQTGTVDFCLADYRPADEADRYCLDTWQWVDLRPLGQVKEIAFTMYTTRRNTYGPTTPFYFCADDFGGERVIVEGAAQDLVLGASVIDLAQFFTFDSEEASIEYRIEDEYDGEVLEAVVEDGRLLVEGKQLGTVELVVSAVQCGKRQFVRIPVTIGNAVGCAKGVSDGTVSVYPVPAKDRLNIRTSMDNYRIEVIAANGACVYVEEGLSGDASVCVSGLDDGVYFLRMSSDDAVVVRRFTKVR